MGLHVVQFVAPAVPLPLQVAHVESQAAHAPAEISYCPMGQVYVHVLDAALNDPPGKQAVQPAEVASVHEAQLLSHKAQLLSTSPNLLDGHVDKHIAPSK